MPWARFDDRFPSNRKIALLSDRAFRLYVTAVCWSAENMTDGVITREELRLIASYRGVNQTVTELITRGLWEETDDGWVIHDYHEYQPSRTQALAAKKSNAARQQRFRDRKNGNTPPPEGTSEGSDNGSSNGASNGRSNGVTNAAPTRPDPTYRGGTGREKGSGSGAPAPEPPLSLIPADWQPSETDVADAQHARTAAGRDELTPQQLAAVTRKFVGRMTDEQRRAPAWGSRWQQWAENERTEPAPGTGGVVVPFNGPQPMSKGAQQRAVLAKLRAEREHGQEETGS